MGIITIDGKDIEVFDVQIDAKPLIDPNFVDTWERFKEGLRSARQKIVVTFDMPMQAEDMQSNGEFTPTGPVIDSNVVFEETSAPDQQCNVNYFDIESERRCYEEMLFGKKRGKQ